MPPVKHACLLVSLLALSIQPEAHANLLQDADSATNSRQFDRAESLLRDWLKTHIWDKEAHLLLGKVLMKQGRHAEAMAEFNELLQKRPENPYYLLAKAEALVEIGKPEEALPVLKLARSVKPSKEEIWRLQLIALLAAGGEDRLRQASAIAKEAKHRFPNADWDHLQTEVHIGSTPQPLTSLRLAAAPSSVVTDAVTDSQPEIAQPVVALKLSMEFMWRPGMGAHIVDRPIPPIPQPSPQPQPLPQPPAAPEQAPAVVPAKAETKYTEIEMGVSHDRLDNDYDPWSASYVTATRQYSENTSAYVTVRQTKRFSLVDREFWAGYYTRPEDNWNVYVEGSVSPTHKILARYSLYGQIGHTFDNGIGLSIGLKDTRYEAASNNTAGLILERYFGSFRAVGSTWKTRLDIGSEWVENHQLQGEYYYGDRNFVGLAYSRGHEIFVGWNLLPEVADSTSWTVNGAHWLNKDWAATYQFVQYYQEDWYTRRGINVGIRHRF